MRWIGVLSGLLLLAPLPAAAQTFVYHVQLGNWTVSTAGVDNCQAFNRNLTEFNVAPYNGLSLRQDAGATEATLSLSFWPGAFTPAQVVSLTFDYFGGAETEVLKGRAESNFAASDFMVTLDRPFDGEELQALAEQQYVTISPDNGAASLAFDTDALTEIAFHLERCAAAIKAQ